MTVWRDFLRFVRLLLIPAYPLIRCYMPIRMCYNTVQTPRSGDIHFFFHSGETLMNYWYFIACYSRLRKIRCTLHTSCTFGNIRYETWVFVMRTTHDESSRIHTHARTLTSGSLIYKTRTWYNTFYGTGVLHRITESWFRNNGVINYSKICYNVRIGFKYRDNITI